MPENNEPQDNSSSPSTRKEKSIRVREFETTNAIGAADLLAISIAPNPKQHTPVIDSEDSPILKLRHQVQAIIDISKKDENLETIASINALFVRGGIHDHLEASLAAIKEIPTLFSQPNGDTPYTSTEYLQRLYQNYSNTVDNINLYSSSLKNLNTEFKIANEERKKIEENIDNLSKPEHDLACAQLSQKFEDIEKRKIELYQKYETVLEQWKNPDNPDLAGAQWQKRKESEGLPSVIPLDEETKKSKNTQRIRS